MIPLLVAGLAALEPLVPIVGTILEKWLKRYAEKLGNEEPELVKEIHATIAAHDAARVSQLLHKLRERKQRGTASQ